MSLILRRITCNHLGPKLEACRHLSSNGGNYDIIIAGGGMVGVSMACALAKNTKLKDKSVLLIDESTEKSWTLGPKYSNRVVSLNPGSKFFLESIGAWEYIEKARYKPVKKLQIWETQSDALLTFNHDDLSEDVSYIVENDLVVNSVEQALKSFRNVVTLKKTKVTDFRVDSSQKTAIVTTSGQQTYNCKLLIGADGANSKVRSTMGVKYLSWDYKQRGIVATLTLSEKTENVVAWQRFLPNGPLALLPLTDDKSSLVWTVSNEEAKHLLSLPDDQFVDAVNDALWKQHPNSDLVKFATSKLNKILESVLLPANTVRQLHPSIIHVEGGSRASFPLAFGHSVKYVAPRVALIGDAAHKVHPLAGLGVNLGFGDIQCLVKVLAEAVYNGAELGHHSCLLDYESVRQRHNFPTMMAIDGLQKLYATNFPPAVLVRSLGVQLTHAFYPLKKALIGHAST